jgi:hypothetical protein
MFIALPSGGMPPLYAPGLGAQRCIGESSGALLRERARVKAIRVGPPGTWACHARFAHERWVLSQRYPSLRIGLEPSTMLKQMTSVVKPL